jgi:hypothetical protein
LDCRNAKLLHRLPLQRVSNLKKTKEDAIVQMVRRPVIVSTFALAQARHLVSSNARFFKSCFRAYMWCPRTSNPLFNIWSHDSANPHMVEKVSIRIVRPAQKRVIKRTFGAGGAIPRYSRGSLSL